MKKNNKNVTFITGLKRDRNGKQQLLQLYVSASSVVKTFLNVFADTGSVSGFGFKMLLFQ